MQNYKDRLNNMNIISMIYKCFVNSYQLSNQILNSKTEKWKIKLRNFEEVIKWTKKVIFKE
jgi:hypothetical protein